MKVRATNLGYYNNIRQYEGMEFFLKKEEDFSQKWMELVEPKASVPSKKSKSMSKKPVMKAEVLDSKSEVI